LNPIGAFIRKESHGDYEDDPRDRLLDMYAACYGFYTSDTLEEAKQDLE